MNDTAPGRQTTVVIVEDDEPTRQRLARAVSADDRLALVGSCGTVSDGLRLLSTYQPTILLTDLGLPDGSGLDLIRHAKASSRSTHSMVVTIFGDEDTVVSAIEAGATGYLLKDDSPRAIGDALVELVNGGSPISPAIARLLLSRIAGATHSKAAAEVVAPRVPALTAREHEVLNLVAKGFKFPEIARTLSVSAHTVTTHVRHIYEKLEVGSRGEAVFEAVQQGLIKLQD
jgi:DNA-binding NarL/FixJ family response regulator